MPAIPARLAFTALFSCSFAVVSHSQAQPASAWAVVVGVDQYQNRGIQPLHGAVADAKGIADALTRYAEVPAAHVSILASDSPSKPTATEIVNKLETIRQSAGPNDLLVFFFAGHGIERDGQRFLLTYNADASNIAALKTTSLPATLLMQELESIRVRHRVVMIDACRDDPTAQTRMPNLATELLETAFTIQPTGDSGVRATFLSTKRGQSAYEWKEKGRGFFSYFIEKGLSGDAAAFGNQVTVTSLADYLNENVPQAVRQTVGKEQTPFVDLKGEALVLVRSDKLKPKPAATATVIMPRTVYGVVKNSEGLPLRDVAITVTVPAPASRSIALVPRAASPAPAARVPILVRSDEDGFFKVDDLPSDNDVEVRAELSGYGARTLTSLAAESGKKMSIFLARTTVASTPPPPTSASMPPPKATPTRTPTPTPTVTATPSPVAPPPALTRPVPGPTAVAPPPPAVDRATELARVGYQSFLAEEFAEAEASARAALQISPDHPLATSVLASALAFAALGDKTRIPEARRQAERAIQLDAALALGYNARGLVFVAEQDLARAQTEFFKASQLDGTLSVAHANLAYTFYRQKRYDDAERAYRNAIRARPESAIPYNGLAQVLTELKKYPDAVQACRDAIARYGPRDQNLSAFYVNLGVALYDQGKRDEALEAIGRAKALGRATDPAYAIIERGVIKK